MKIVAAILAGGSGKRMQTDLPKQFTKLVNKPVLQYSMEAFAESGRVDAIIIVTHPDYKSLVPVNELPLTIPIYVIPGGSSRNLSSLQAIEFAKSKFPPEDTAIVFHDSARPNIQKDTINRIVDSIQKTPVAVAVSGIYDTLYKVDEEYVFCEVLNRDQVLKAQTPQAFHLDVIIEAYKRKHIEGDNDFTDDVGIVKNYLPEVSIQFIKDSPLNIKLSYPEDMEILELLIKKRIDLQ